jgi:small GTP-binding protein
VAIIERVGKTSLSLRYCKNFFNDNEPSSVDASYLEKVIKVNEQPIKLAIWDTAGQEKYHALNSNYYNGAHGIKIWMNYWQMI